jgi:hypothetical protein
VVRYIGMDVHREFAQIAVVEDAWRGLSQAPISGASACGILGVLPTGLGVFGLPFPALSLHQSVAPVTGIHPHPLGSSDRRGPGDVADTTRSRAGTRLAVAGYACTV